MNLTDWYDQMLARIEQRKASDRAVAKAVGMTVAEFDADVTAPDPCLYPKVIRRGGYFEIVLGQRPRRRRKKRS